MRYVPSSGTGAVTTVVVGGAGRSRPTGRQARDLVFVLAITCRPRTGQPIATPLPHRPGSGVAGAAVGSPSAVAVEVVQAARQRGR